MVLIILATDRREQCRREETVPWKNWNKEENKIKRKYKRAGPERAGIQERILLALFHHNPGILLITWFFYKQLLTILSEGQG